MERTKTRIGSRVFSYVSGVPSAMLRALALLMVFPQLTRVPLVSAVLAAFLQLVLCVLVVNEARITKKKHGRLVQSPQAAEVDL